MESISVHPKWLVLRHADASAQVVVTARLEDGSAVDVTRQAKFGLENGEARIRIEDARVYGLRNGRVRVPVHAAGLSTSLSVTVSRSEEPRVASFLYDTLPALTKQGCNSGGCHGAPSGKAGFRLSLFAYDPELDRQTMMREAFQRRIDLQNPAASLILRKPLTVVPHGGGERLRVDDPAYRRLYEWIDQGCPQEEESVPTCVGLEIFPEKRLLRYPAVEQQLVARARFSDGTSRDVTDIAVYSSSDDGLASVDLRGLVTSSARGDVTVLVQYLHHSATADLTFVRDVEGFVWSEAPAKNFIDRHVADKLRQMQITPSPRCTDREFIRRLYLDVLGVLPERGEVERFLNDDAADKRSAWIDKVLTRPEHAEFWAMRWGDLLRVTPKTMSAPGVHKFHRWLVRSIRENRPYDDFVAELLTAGGSTFENPAANYFRSAADLNDCAETTAQTFLGVRLQCAKCHNHPYERWTQDNYYGFASFFNRVQRTPLEAGELLVWTDRSGEVTQPRTRETMRPWLPVVGELSLDDEEERRPVLVAWLRRKDNPYFARVAVNRLWAHFMGRGIVEPVDDLRDSNPPSNRALLNALAEEFVASGFDRRAVIRAILTSATYQRSSRGSLPDSSTGRSSDAFDARYFSRQRPRPLSAEQTLDAVCRVTGVPEAFEGLPAGVLATQLPSPDFGGELVGAFLRAFGKPERDTACPCERNDRSDLARVLELINGDTVLRKLRDESNRFRRLLAAGKSDSEILDDLYWAAFAREPTAAERQASLAYLRDVGNRIEAFEDVTWTIFNSKEFLFQH